ncbi:hypothetical protein [Mycoplasmopsis adleri]|uniref:hypothetical protein n=1 Tax=Mycoplasmopsis adleri TaxID=51362 RepID=UPI0038737E56
MIKAKKRKILKSALIMSGTILAIGALSTGIYFSLKKNNLNNNSQIISFKNPEPKLSDVKIVIIPDKISLTDQNNSAVVKTTVKFLNTKDNDSVVKIHDIITKPNEGIDIKIESLIPNGYVLDSTKYVEGQQIKIEAGKVAKFLLFQKLKLKKLLLHFMMIIEKFIKLKLN